MFTGAGLGAVALCVASYFAVDVDFGSEAYALDSSGRLVFWFPLEWAANEYSREGEFPVDTDSLLGVVTYWLPSPGRMSAAWRPQPYYPLRGWDAQWWGRWVHPLDFSVDGEYAETGAHPVPVPLLAYATCLPAAAMWAPWKRRRAGSCPDCGYSLLGLPARDGRLVCPECGLASGPGAKCRRV